MLEKILTPLAKIPPQIINQFFTFLPLRIYLDKARLLLLLKTPRVDITLWPMK